MRLQRFLLLLALPLLVSLPACIGIPLEEGHEEAFKNEKLAFIEIGKSTKEEIATTMSDFPMETYEGKVRVNLTPQKFRGGDWWLYAQVRKEAKWDVATVGGSFKYGDVDHRFLLIKYDNNGIVADYELSASKGTGCNKYGICVAGSHYNLIASEDEDRDSKEFDIPADRCGVYVYGKPGFGSPSRSGMPLRLDDHRVVWLLDKKQYIFWQLDHGVHQLQGGHQPDSAVEFSCTAGGLYFFELKIKSKGLFGTRSSIEQLDAAKGHKAIGKRQLALNVDEPSN